MAVQPRRVPALIAVLVAGIALLAPTPASAQIPAGSQATPLVGTGIVASCPPNVPAALDAGTATVNGVTVGFPGAGRCTPLAADAEGSYTVDGSFTNPLPFTSECANTGGVVTSRSGVTVPTGTIVNGVAVASPTVVEAPNAFVVFPGGRTAILNQRIETPTSVTQNAIVFTGGPIVGQVVCGTVAYPLAVETAASGGVAPVGLPVASDGDGGPSTGLLMLGGVVALALMVQVAVGRRVWRNRTNATA